MLPKIYQLMRTWCNACLPVGRVDTLTRKWSMRKYFVYAIKSIANNYTYVGLSEDPIKRLKQHNFGRTKSNCHYKPFKIIFTDGPFDLRTARDKEKYYKSGCGKEFLKSISQWYERTWCNGRHTGLRLLAILWHEGSSPSVRIRFIMFYSRWCDDA